MTVANNYHKVSYVGNGSTKDFSFDFPVLETSSIKVYVSTNGKETEVDASNYSVNISGNGGSVVFKTAPANKSIVAIIRLTDQTQETPYKTSSGFPAVRVEEAFDKLTMITQEHQEVLERCVKVVPTNGQKPQELLDEVYARLDSSIEIAESAQKAANEASSAVVRAEGLLEDTTEYVTTSKAEIGTLKTETINQVEGVSASAIASVTSTSLAAVNSINTAKTTAETNIAKIVSNAEGSIEKIAVEAAQKEVENAANQAVEIASTNINAYVDGTVKPSLSSYVNEAKGYRDNALIYSNNAKTSETKAKTSESNALSYKNSASSSASTATYQANIATTKASEAAVSANRAENATSNKANLNLGNSTAITNCITQIPQDIKLELVDGTLTLKAGSKVYVPNGAGKFDVVNITSDINFTYTYAPSTNTQCMLFINNTGTGFIKTRTVAACFSGTTQPSGNYRNWYNTAENKMYSIADNATVDGVGFSFPIAIITQGSDGITKSIDQVFNGFGYIGSTVFALPNVKGLIPNGRNTDGSLRNIEAVATSVTTTTINEKGREVTVFLEQNGKISKWGSDVGHVIQYKTRPATPEKIYVKAYIEDENVWWYGDNTTTWINKQYLVPLFKVYTDTNAYITSSQPKLPFRAVDYNDLNDEVKKLELNMPAGSILPFAGQTAPSGFLICDGATVSRTTYADLFKVIGTTYGTGDGSTTFNLPNYSNARMITSSTVPVKGNGNALGLTDGSTNYSMTTRGYSSAKGYLSVGNLNTSALPQTISDIGDSYGMGKGTGLSTDSSKSGITGTASLAISCKFIIKY